MIRHVNAVTGASPFESMMVADIGDMSVIPFNVERTCRIIKEETAKIIEDGCRPLSMGGDHLVTYPVLQAMKVYNVNPLSGYAPILLSNSRQCYS
jgi:arginase family enzyme